MPKIDRIKDMAQLGTLWFGADIDMTKLQQKIKSGNQSVLDALKINYDQASYQQMVSRLRTDLAKEHFEIKLSANTQNIVQNIKNSTKGGLSGTTISGLDAFNEKIVRQQHLVNDLTATVARLKAEYSKLGGQSRKTALVDARAELAQEKAALQNLLANRKAYNASVAETAKAQRQAAAELKRIQSDSIRLNTTLANGVHISTQFGSALSSLFAVDAARQFLGKVIEIGGQLEKQRISIGAILGDTVKANHLFDQIKGLALKSPFGVVELDQYTKQLSAYGFQYNELFDMTKRLADISAGAGTDIGRLTLALGHVRSATYLTGITLRQFSMNNIPMLKMLADYYTEVEKKAVSTAEVQKRISKRQVSYEDVIEQIRRLTDEGGMFYNMQEKISESLAAKFKNLKDAMDIMYGEMAEGKVGDLLKGLASVLLKATRHWGEIARVMAVAAVGFGIIKIRAGMSAIALRGTTAATLKQVMSTKQLEASNLRAAASYRTLSMEEKTKIATANTLTAADAKRALMAKELSREQLLTAIALKRMNAAEAQALVKLGVLQQKEVAAALAANRLNVAWAGLTMSLRNTFSGISAWSWATIGAMVGMELYASYSAWVDRIDGKTQEMKDLIKSRVIDLEKMQNTIKKEGKPKDSTALQGRVDDMKQVLANSEAYTKTIDDQLAKSSSLSEQYDILAKSIGDAADKNRQMLDYQDRINKMIKASSLGNANGLFDHGFWEFPLFNYFTNDDIAENMSETLDTYKELRQVIDGLWEYKDAISESIDEMLKSNEVSEAFKEQLRNAPFEEQIQLLAESGYWGILKGKVIARKVEFVEFADKLKEAAEGVTKRWEEIATDDIPRMLRKEAAVMGKSEKELRDWALNNIDDFKMMLDGINDQLGIQEPEIRKRLKKLFYDYVSFAGISKAIIEGEEIGRMIGGEDNLLKKLLDDDKKANLHDNKANASKDGDKNKKDKDLEAAKTKLEQYKAFLTEYKKYREHYSKEKAISLLEDLFPDLKGKGKRLVDDYVSMLDELRDSLPATTEARKKFQNEVNKTKADTIFDREKETIKENTEAIKEYIKQMEEQWKLYRSLLKKSGGNKDIAQLAFSDNGRIWDDTAKDMLKKFNTRGNQLGVLPVGFSWDMNEKEMREALVDAKGQIQDELVELALEIKKVTEQNFVQFLEDSAEAYSKSLSAAQKLTELERQREDLVKARKADNDKSDAKQKGWDVQIAAKDKEIASQRWEAFKETEEWGRIFGNLDRLSTDTLKGMLNKLKEIAPSINEDAAAMKALYEAIEKIDEVINQRNPFAKMVESLRSASAIRKLLKTGLTDYGFRNAEGTFSIGAENARKLGLSVKKNGKYSERELRDALRGTESDFAETISDLEKQFKAVQEVLQPVIDLFEQLGNESLSSFFSIGGNAFGAAAQVAGGLNTLGLGSLGPYGAAAAAALSVTSSLLAMHDESLQKEIEASQARQKEMENLTKNLEKALERTLGGVYETTATSDMLSTLRNEIKSGSFLTKFFGDYKTYMGQDTIKAVKEAEKSKSYYDATYASLLAQRDEIKHQQQLEEGKKKKNEEAIADYQQQLEEMDDQIKNFAADMAKALYDIDIKSWAEDLGSALFEAWQKGEDGAEAFKKKASEIIAELAQKIAVTKLIETAMQPVLDAVTSEMEKKNGQLDEQSISAISDAMNLVGTTLPQSFNNLMDGLNQGMMKAGLADMRQLEESTESSSTTAGIKSITETTADLLASYINAVRADVSMMRMEQSINLPAITLAVQRTSVLAETQVQLQTQIAANTLRNADAAERIYDIMHKIDTGITKVKVG